LEAKLARQTKLDEQLQVAVNQEVQQAPDAEASSNAWQFITNHFDTLYHSPEAIDNLKKNILNEAVRGRLVAQDPIDEPASELLKKIEAEKQRLYDEGEIRKPKKLPPVSEDEVPFEIPEGWEWTTLNEAGQINPRNKADDRIEASFISMSMISEGYMKMHETETRPWKDIKSGYTHFAENDVGLAKITPCFQNGKAAIFTGLKNSIGAGTTELYIFRSLIPDLIPEYVYAFLKSSMFVAKGVSKMSGTAGQQRVSKDYFQNSPFPLPPALEQKRIVQRIEELFAICDQFKARLEERSAVNERLVKGLVGEVLENAAAVDSPAEDKELSKAAEPAVVYQISSQKNQPEFGEPEEKHFFKRKILGCYIINQSLDDPKFGDTKFEKLLHLADYWAVQRNFNQRYYKKPAGPYDNRFTKQFFNQVLKAKWYRKVPLGNMNRIIAGAKQEKSTNYYDLFTEVEFQRVDQLIQYFRKSSYEQPEIVSTLFAVWNNRIIRNQSVTDESIIKDFLEWDKQKARYTERLQPALDWMRKFGIIPNGWGEVIEHPKKK